jgi:hypothetical protein
VWLRRVESYRAQVALHGSYFLRQAYERDDPFLVRHAAVHTCLAAGRTALAGRRQLFRGQKYLRKDLHALTGLPAGLVPAWERLLAEATPEAATDLTSELDRWLGDPLDGDHALSRFITDNELAWLNRTIPPEFW